MNRADATVTGEHRPESAGDPRVQIYQGRIPPGPMLRANLVTVLARAAVMWPMWVLMGLALAGVASYGLHLGVPARYVLTDILTRTTLAALGFVAAVTLIRTARMYLARRTHTLHLGILREGWRTAAVWVDHPKGGGPWRVQVIGAIPLRRGLGARLIRAAVKHADAHQAVVTAKARNDALAAVYERYGFTRNTPGGRQMTRNPSPRVLCRNGQRLE